MRTLLDDGATLLSESEKRCLTDNEYCKSEMRLQIGNLGFLRRIEEGREIRERARYWKERYGGFYVCSEWWRDHHRANAKSLLGFVEGLGRRKSEDEAALRPHAQGSISAWIQQPLIIQEVCKSASRIGRHQRENADRA